MKRTLCGHTLNALSDGKTSSAISSCLVDQTWKLTVNLQSVCAQLIVTRLNILCWFSGDEPEQFCGNEPEHEHLKAITEKYHAF